MQYDIRMLAASGERRWCLANVRNGYNSGLEPNSSFTWLLTESPPGFHPVILRKLFSPICMRYGWNIFLGGKISQIFSSGPAFKCKQRGFWRYLLVEDKWRRVFPWAYRGKSTLESFCTVSLTAPSSFCAYLWIWFCCLITVLIILLMLHSPL